MVAGFEDVGFFADNNRADGDAARKTFGKRHDIRFDFSPLMSEPFPGASDAGLDFVAHHKDVVLIAEFSETAHVAEFKRNYAAFAENRFKEDGNDVFVFLDDLLDFCEITFFNRNEALCVRREVRFDRGVACRRQSRDGAAVEGVLHDDNVGYVDSFEVSEFTSDFDGAFVGFETAVAEKDGVQTGVFDEFLGYLFLKIDVEIVRAVDQFRGLI